MIRLTPKTQALASVAFMLVLSAWQLYGYSRHLELNRQALEMWAGGILFGEIIGWIITHPGPGAAAPSKVGLLLFAEFFIVIAVGIALTHASGVGFILGMAMPFINAGLGRPFVVSRNVIIVVSIIALPSEKYLWFLPAAIATYYVLHAFLIFRMRVAK
jgi:hypothetical protein